MELPFSPSSHSIVVFFYHDIFNLLKGLQERKKQLLNDLLSLSWHFQPVERSTVKKNTTIEWDDGEKGNSNLIHIKECNYVKNYYLKNKSRKKYFTYMQINLKSSFWLKLNKKITDKQKCFLSKTLNSPLIIIITANIWRISFHERSFCYRNFIFNNCQFPLIFMAILKYRLMYIFRVFLEFELQLINTFK